jgi:glycosyltransferase involved in cell wall biosynthesis
MRVVHVLWSGGVGGIERLVHDLAGEQARRGLDVSVAFGRPVGPFATSLRDAGVRVVDLGLRSGYDLRPPRLACGARCMRAADVVHLHGYNVPFAAMALGARRPVVFTEHGTFGAGRRVGIAGTLKRRLRREFLRRSVRTIAANSVHTANVASRIYGLPPERITVVYNGLRFGEPRSPPVRGTG